MNTTKITSSVRRLAASAVLATGLAYPACAAVCPKGIGGCPNPGRCFLFVDADANSLCDYTSRSGTTQASGAFPSRPAAPATARTAVPATPAPDPTVVQTAAASSGSPAALPVTTTPASGAHTVSVTTASTPVPDAAANLVRNASSGGLINLRSLDGAAVDECHGRRNPAHHCLAGQPEDNGLCPALLVRGRQQFVNSLPPFFISDEQIYFITTDRC